LNFTLNLLEAAILSKMGAWFWIGIFAEKKYETPVYTFCKSTADKPD